MTPEEAAALREPFPPNLIGKLPRVTQKDGAKSRCSECGGWLPPHIHLDFVGHAAATDRLLKVDREWNWEPLALDADGIPVVRRQGSMASMWIKLTICGVTRICVGTAPSGKDELEKELISDAIRNGAMRFGVALDLWSKEDLLAPVDAETGEIAAGGAAGDTTPPASTTGDRGAPAAPSDAPLATKPQRAKIDHLVDTTGAIPQVWPLPDDFTKADASKLIDHLLTLPVEPPAERVSTLRTDAEAAQQEFVQ